MQACTATVSLQRAASVNGSTRPARKHNQVAQATARADVPSRRSVPPQQQTRMRAHLLVKRDRLSLSLKFCRAAALLITAIPAILATPAFAKDADKAKAA